MNLDCPPPGCGVVVPLMGVPFKSPPPLGGALGHPQAQRRSLKHPRGEDRKVKQSRTPWIQHGTLRLPGVLGLHQEIDDFYAWMLPTTLEHNLRLDVVERIRGAINDLYPAARVEISGSFRTGLYLPTSDIDLVICGKWETLPLRTIERILLEKKIACPDSLRVLDKAAVPIVKLTDIRSDIKVDISFNMSNGVRAAELIKHFKKRYPSLPKLIYVLKQFLLQRDLNEVFTGGLSSYSLILLVISYFQHHYSQETASSVRANLGVMLIEILELYGRNFNFMNTAIRITDGGAYISKSKFQKVIANGYAPALLSIEDPLDPTNDVGRSSYGFVAVQNSFDRAFAVLTSLIFSQSPLPEGKSILSSIVEIPEEVSDYRHWMCDQFPFLGSPLNYIFPAVPPQYYRAPLEIVTPRELPSVRPTSQFIPAVSKESKSTSPALQTPLAPSSIVAGGNDLSDCLSSVSTGTCPSHSSPLDSLSDTDSDEVIIGGVGPTLTPHSAMSISPANSEIGGSIGKFDDPLREGGRCSSGSVSKRTSKGAQEGAAQKRCPSSSSNSSRGSFKHPSSNNPHHPKSSRPSSSSNRNNNNNHISLSSNISTTNNSSSSKHSKKDVSRSDAVLNWRSPERRKKMSVSSCNNSSDDKQQQPHSTTTSPQDTSKTSALKSPPTHLGGDSRADRDSNWREREQNTSTSSPRDRNGNTQQQQQQHLNGCCSQVENNNSNTNSSVKCSTPELALHNSTNNPSSSSQTANNIINNSNNINNDNTNSASVLTTSNHHFSVSSSGSNSGTLVKHKKKHKKNHNKSSFNKYPVSVGSPKVKESNQCSTKFVESSRQDGSDYLSLVDCKDRVSSRCLASSSSNVKSTSSSSSMKKRRKSNSSSKASPPDESLSIKPPLMKATAASLQQQQQHQQNNPSSRFSPKAHLGNGKR